jgi:VanZ family protein
VEDVRAARRSLVAWLPPIAWACGLLLLSAQPADRLPASELWQVDKLVHALLYAALGALTGRALVVRARPRRAAGWTVAVAALGLACFGMLDEWSQSFTPGRMSSAADALADAVGGWAGLLAASRYYGRRDAATPQLRR